MSKLIAMLRHDFPDYEYLDVFEAAIPAYFIQMVLEVLEKRELKTFQSYVLQLVALGINSLEQIAYCLGVDPETLTSSVADLLKSRYIDQSDPLPGREERLLLLTDEGRKALDKQGPPPVPTRKTGRFYFNALSWNTVSSKEEILYPDQAEKQGLFILPRKEEERPTLGTFTEQAVKSVLKDEPAFAEDSIVALLKLKEAKPRYFGPVTVVVLQHRDTREKTVSVYRNNVQQRPETEALQRLFEAKKFQIPSSAVPLLQGDQDLHLPSSLPQPVVEEILNAVKNERARQEITIQVEENNIRKTATQDARERKELEQKILQLQAELQSMDKDIAALHEQLRQSKVEFLRTEQHREWLLRAIREAKQEVIIISPWMNRTACDDHFCELFAKALARGVRMCIGYGMGHERYPAETNRNKRNVDEVKFAIKKRIRDTDPTPFLRDIVETTGTHQKILVCDRQFAITGSFNWLSYTGKQNEGYRQELSVLFRYIDQVNELANIGIQVWKSTK
jgi:DNA-binding MarR family transcriptional regulator